MATINVVQWAGKGSVPGREVELPVGFLKAENVTVTTAQKYELEANTRLVEVVDVTGGAYARSGHSGLADITAGAGSVILNTIGIPSRYIIIEESDRATGNPRLLMIAV